jgi:hypothetical protein
MQEGGKLTGDVDWDISGAGCIVQHIAVIASRVDPLF